jgi:hypothetical protein
MLEITYGKLFPYSFELQVCHGSWPGIPRQPACIGCHSVNGVSLGGLPFGAGLMSPTRWHRLIVCSSAGPAHTVGISPIGFARFPGRPRR